MHARACTVVLQQRCVPHTQCTCQVSNQVPPDDDGVLTCCCAPVAALQACRVLVEAGTDLLRRNGKNRIPGSQLKVRGCDAHQGVAAWLQGKGREGELSCRPESGWLYCELPRISCGCQLLADWT